MEFYSAMLGRISILVNQGMKHSDYYRYSARILASTTTIADAAISTTTAIVALAQFF
jgi:hypothetical protein